MTSLRRDPRAALRTWARSPLTWILVACGILHIVGIGWGLPASDGWDNDGVAPRDFLAGLVETFTPGHYFTYPPFHLLTLGVLTLPITGVALAHAHSFSPPDVIAEVLKVPYMTGIAYVARATSVAMSLGIVYAIAKIAESIRGPRAGLCAAAVCSVDVTFTYYAHTTNLDVPYMFWASFALLALVRAISLGEPRRLRAFVVLAVLAIASKDQAYALFLVSTPLAIGAWLVVGREQPGARAILRGLGIAVARGAALFLLIDGVIWNPTGFWARLHFLAGPASQDFAMYAKSFDGRMLILEDTAGPYAALWPSAFVVLACGGVLLHLWRARSEGANAIWVAGLVPLLAGISFTLAFNCVARRVEHRFILPQSLMLAVYGGLSVHAFLFELRDRFLRLVAAGALLAAFGRGLMLAAAVDVNLLYDPRYDIERWLEAHAAPGDRVETYGLNVYLPRFPEMVRVTRVGPEPAARRNPMPTFDEVQDRFENVAQRDPRWITFSECWAWRYLIPLPAETNRGALTPSTQVSTRGDTSAGTYFHELLDGHRGYHVVLDSVFESAVWQRVRIHASIGCEAWLLERNEGPQNH